jgi:hypothetical protein
MSCGRTGLGPDGQFGKNALSGLGLRRFPINWSLEDDTILMAPDDENAMFMQRMKDPRLRQLWRLTNTLIKVRNRALTHKDVKNEDRPDYVYENKGERDKMDDN